MAVATATLISEDASETMQMGVRIVVIDQVWQVLSDSRTESVDVVRSANSLPQLRGQETYDGTKVYVVSVVPRRSDAAKTGKKWSVAVRLTNDTKQFAHDHTGAPVSSPVDAVKTVDVDWVSSERPIRSAKYLHTTRGPFHEAFDPDAFSVTDDINPAKRITTANWLTDHVGPIINSAGDTRFATKPIYYRRFTVSRYLDQWTEEITGFLGKTNDAEVTIVEMDGVSAKATYTIPKYNLLVQDVVKRNVWIGGTLFFKASIVLLESPESWIHSELDAGQRYRVYAGQDKLGGGQWTQTELDNLNPPVGAGSFSLRNIERGTIAIGDPEKLNGHGMTLADTVGASYASPPLEEQDVVYVNFETYTPVNFNDLDL